MPRNPTYHYSSPAARTDGAVLDPTRPEGLVYYTVDGQTPVLLGAVFVAPRGVEAPTPAADLVVWHSHDPTCAGFFATAADPCTSARRMLHVWTVDTTTVAPEDRPIGRRAGDRSVRRALLRIGRARLTPLPATCAGAEMGRYGSMEDRTVVVIEDDAHIAELLELYLGQAGFRVACAGAGEPGLTLVDDRRPALVIVDIGLPDIDGFEVCRRLRARSAVPIVVLTARGEETDRVVGLELGADDYVTKPFSPRSWWPG